VSIAQARTFPCFALDIDAIDRGVHRPHCTRDARSAFVSLTRAERTAAHASQALAITPYTHQGAISMTFVRIGYKFFRNKR